ncbi:hypothetical protein ACFL1X_10470, partial [Candidatus Hydrogenedentota bacterium]
RDESEVLVTSGDLTWTFVPSGGGDPVIVSTELQEIEGPSGPLSYTVLLPLESAVEGYPLSANRIPLTDASVAYAGIAEIAGTEIIGATVVSVSTNVRGSTFRAGQRRRRRRRWPAGCLGD